MSNNWYFQKLLRKIKKVLSKQKLCLKTQLWKPIFFVNAFLTYFNFMYNVIFHPIIGIFIYFMKTKKNIFQIYSKKSSILKLISQNFQSKFC